MTTINPQTKTAHTHHWNNNENLFFFPVCKNYHLPPTQQSSGWEGCGKGAWALAILSALLHNCVAEMPHFRWEHFLRAPPREYYKCCMNKSCYLQLFPIKEKHLALAWWQIFLNEPKEVSDDICSLCFPGGMRYGTIQVHCEEAITSLDIWIKRQLCLPEQLRAPFTQREFVRLSRGEKALLCSYSIKLEAWKPQEDGGWRLSICLTHNLNTMEKRKEGGGGVWRKKSGTKLFFWLENSIRNRDCYNHFLPTHPVTITHSHCALESNTAIPCHSLAAKLSKSPSCSQCTRTRGVRMNPRHIHRGLPSTHQSFLSILCQSFWQGSWKHQLRGLYW